MDKLEYKDVIALGFKKDTTPIDEVFYNRHGFEYFIVSKSLNKKLSMDWDIITHNINLYKNNNIFKRNLTISEVKEYINLLK